MVSVRSAGAGWRPSTWPRTRAWAAQVAVKRLHADSPEDIERRFAREAKVGASLNHPNLVWVFDAVTDDEGVLIVMEYVDGPTLAASSRASRCARDGRWRWSPPWPRARARPRARDRAPRRQAGQRPAAARRGDQARRPRDSDRGRPHADHQQRPALGTASYMAPEQLEGERVDARHRRLRAGHRGLRGAHRPQGARRAAPRWRSPTRSPPSLRPTCARPGSTRPPRRPRCSSGAWPANPSGAPIGVRPRLRTGPRARRGDHGPRSSRRGAGGDRRGAGPGPCYAPRAANAAARSGQPDDCHARSAFAHTRSAVATATQLAGPVAPGCPPRAGRADRRGRGACPGGDRRRARLDRGRRL